MQNFGQCVRKETFSSKFPGIYFFKEGAGFTPAKPFLLTGMSTSDKVINTQLRVLFLGYLFCDGRSNCFFMPRFENRYMLGTENVVFLAKGLTRTAGKRLQTHLHSVCNRVHNKILQASVNRNIYTYDLERI